jgi:hypothetical protein
VITSHLANAYQMEVPYVCKIRQRRCRVRLDRPAVGQLCEHPYFRPFRGARPLYPSLR